MRTADFSVGVGGSVVNIANLSPAGLASFYDGLRDQVEQDELAVYRDLQVHPVVVRLRDAFAAKVDGIEPQTIYEALRDEARQAPRAGLVWCCGMIERRRVSSGLNVEDVELLRAYIDELHARGQGRPS